MSTLQQAQYVMGTLVEARIECEAERAACDHGGALLAKVFAVFERVATMCNRFDPESELSMLNRHAAHHPVKVSRELFGLIERGLASTYQTRSAFSVLLQPLVELWACAAKRDRSPSEAELARARGLCSPDQVRLHQADCTLSFAQPGMGFNLDGVAKGYAADCARDVLRSVGVRTATINVGSSSLGFLDVPRCNRERRLLIRPPAGDGAVASYIVKEDSVSTSGTGERDLMIEGKRYSHLIAAATGRPLQGNLTATAIGSSCEATEVASKVLLFHGYQEGIALCRRLGISSAGFVLRSGRKGMAHQIEGCPSLGLSEC